MSTAQTIEGKLPSPFNPGESPDLQTLVASFGSGFDAMWMAAVTSIGPGSPPGPNPHNHLIQVIVSSLMKAAKPVQLSGDAKSFFDTVCDGVETHAKTIQSDIQDGTVPHKHRWLPVQGAPINGLIKSKVRFSKGPGWSKSECVLDEFITALADSFAEVMTNSDMTISAGPGHVHTLLP